MTQSEMWETAHQLDAMSQYRKANKQAITIPAGTRARPCDGARCKEMIYDVGRQPVSLMPYRDKDGVEKVPAGIAPTDKVDGVGINHFSNCIDRNKFKR